MKGHTKDRVPGIYCIVNKTNGKKYIGKAYNIYRRINEHKSRLISKDKNENPHLINAWHKYGQENFDYEVVERLPLDEILIAERELYWQEFYKTTDRNIGYNLRQDSSTGIIVHKETRKKMSDVHKERMSTPEMREKVSKQFRDYWKNNPDKLKEMGKQVGDLMRKYSIVQMDRSLNILGEFTREQIREQGWYLQAVLAVCNGSKASYKNYFWRYRDLKTKEIVQQRDRKAKRIPIVMISKKDNKVIMEFISAYHAGKWIGQTGGNNITSQCKKKTCVKKEDYYFRYKSDYEKGEI